MMHRLGYTAQAKQQDAIRHYAAEQQDAGTGTAALQTP